MSDPHHQELKPDEGDPNRWKDDSWSVFAINYSGKTFWITFAMAVVYACAALMVTDTAFWIPLLISLAAFGVVLYWVMFRK
ncbi:MAG: hypothetical protein K8H88_05260 [Sandaracinaceae bacterium]|nr:hypothetical protein [Sandaracinaceae bacterium]